MGLVQLHSIREAKELPSDQQRLAGLIAELDSAHPSFAAFAPALVERLRALLSLDAAVVYRVTRTGLEYSLVTASTVVAYSAAAVLFSF